SIRCSAAPTKWSSPTEFGLPPVGNTNRSCRTSFANNQPLFDSVYFPPARSPPAHSVHRKAVCSIAIETLQRRHMPFHSIHGPFARKIKLSATAPLQWIPIWNQVVSRKSGDKLFRNT